ncbi:restriction endonuclease subunit S [uncultured Granulicatella sp.]|uniref:restriction endonuclease subunit S n=1 Tax=uncultured Granulicatella sp. TaxID=316089 RepID=UPI0026243039|nr:restriction endonuclease subunit S [uncultured Granulicatella sp.]
MNQKWNYVPFEDAVEIWDIKRKPINNAERASRINGKSNNELYPYYGATGQVGFIDDYLTDGEYVLLGEDGAPFLNPIAQKAYIVTGKTWVNNHAHVLKSKYNNKFLCYYLNSINYKDYVSGTTRLKLTQAQMKRILIPVPSIEEQERIVAKIEELFSELDNAVETLNATKVQLEVYKQTVLYEAFSNLSDTVDMQEIATMIDPQPSHRTPPEVVGGIPYIGIGDIDYDNNIIKFDSARKVSASVLAEHLSRYTISKGDFVMGKIGTIGKPYRIPIPQEYALSANVILIQPNHELILPDFLYWQFSSHHVTSQLLKGANATSQPAFGIKKSRLLKIKMCDFEQQRAINLDIESKISVYESIAHTVEKSLEEASAMRQSILKQAFEGRLL